MAANKELHGILNDVLSSFVSRNNNLDGYWAIGKLHALSVSQEGFDISLDLVKTRAASSHQDIETVRETYHTLLVRLVKNREFSERVFVLVVITLMFDASVDSPNASSNVSKSKFLASIVAMDTHGGWYKHSISGWSRPHNPQLETRRSPG